MNYIKCWSRNKSDIRSVTYLIEKPLRSTVNGSPFSDKNIFQLKDAMH
ncbi:hypothetical protein PHOSAC3_120093 [Mesotoga infera]|nr:hypothetical protein PHOSAC3_120093 [Mesotoga infera]